MITFAVDIAGSVYCRRGYCSPYQRMPFGTLPAQVFRAAAPCGPHSWRLCPHVVAMTHSVVHA
eukprot:1203708-Amphidinium_carterae.2